MTAPTVVPAPRGFTHADPAPDAVHAPGTPSEFVFEVPSIAVPIPLRGADGSIRAYTFVDEADFEFVNQWQWRFDGRYAARRGSSGKPIRLHRVLLGLDPGNPLQGDHINRDRLDNRRSNLRIVTHAENSQNVPARTTSTSSFRGVSWSTAKQRWQAKARIDGKLRWFGYFDDEEEAARVVRDARLKGMPGAVD